MKTNTRYFGIRFQRQLRYKCIDNRFFKELRFWLYKTTDNIPNEGDEFIKGIHYKGIRFSIRFPLIFIIFK